MFIFSRDCARKWDVVEKHKTMTGLYSLSKTNEKQNLRLINIHWWKQLCFLQISQRWWCCCCCLKITWNICLCLRVETKLYYSYDFALYYSQTRVKDRFQITTTYVQRPPFLGPVFNIYIIKVALNNDHLSAILGSQGWSLYISLTVCTLIIFHENKYIFMHYSFSDTEQSVLHSH